MGQVPGNMDVVMGSGGLQIKIPLEDMLEHAIAECEEWDMDVIIDAVLNTSDLRKAMLSRLGDYGKTTLSLGEWEEALAEFRLHREELRLKAIARKMVELQHDVVKQATVYDTVGNTYAWLSRLGAQLDEGQIDNAEFIRSTRQAIENHRHVLDKLRPSSYTYAEGWQYLIGKKPHEVEVEWIEWVKNWVEGDGDLPVTPPKTVEAYTRDRIEALLRLRNAYSYYPATPHEYADQKPVVLKGLLDDLMTAIFNPGGHLADPIFSEAEA